MIIHAQSPPWPPNPYFYYSLHKCRSISALALNVGTAGKPCGAEASDVRVISRILQFIVEIAFYYVALTGCIYFFCYKWNRLHDTNCPEFHGITASRHQGWLQHFERDTNFSRPSPLRLRLCLQIEIQATSPVWTLLTTANSLTTSATQSERTKATIRYITTHQIVTVLYIYTPTYSNLPAHIYYLYAPDRRIHFYFYTFFFVI